jgi:hypothetical protein
MNVIFLGSLCVVLMMLVVVRPVLMMQPWDVGGYGYMSLGWGRVLVLGVAGQKVLRYRVGEGAVREGTGLESDGQTRERPGRHCC